jgi:hypothetical protein
MGLFYFQPGTSSYAPSRCGWSSVDPAGAYGTLDTSGPVTAQGIPVVECYFDSSNGTLNITIGASEPGFISSPAFNGYSAGTAYVPGNVVSAGVPFVYWLCIQNSTGNAPASSPTYWQQCAVTGWPKPLPTGPSIVISPPVYSASVTYYEGSIVSYQYTDSFGAHGSIFECQATTTGTAPVAGESTADWFDLAQDFLFFIDGIPVAPFIPYVQNPFEPVTLWMLQLTEALVYGYPLIDGGLGEIGAYCTPYSSQFSGSGNPSGLNISTTTELGPGFVRYSWPAGLVPSSPNSAPLPLFNLSGPEYAVNVL